MVALQRIEGRDDGARWQPPKQKKRRWTPPSKRGDRGDAPPVADAAADLAREAAGVAAGAVVADPRAALVALPRGATGVEWGTDLSFVGVYVRALLPGGAAFSLFTNRVAPFA